MKLKRVIGRWDLVLLMINSLVGSGIFGLPSKIFSQAGIYSLLVIIFCAAVILVLVLNFAEVASRFTKTGGPYLYTLTAFGKFPAFLMGWLILITRLATYAALVNIFVTYLGVFNPAFETQTAKITTIFILTLFFTLVNHFGVKGSTILNNSLTIAKLLPLFVFIIVGLFFINPDNFNLNESTPALFEFSNSIFLMVFAFSGFEAIIVNTGEIKTPRKNIPIALLFTISFVTVFYVLLQMVCIGTFPGLAESERPIADAALQFMGPIGALLISVGALFSVGGTINTVMLIGSRLPYALSSENQLPGFLSFVHKKFQTPTWSLFLFATFAFLVSATGTFIYAVSISVISKVMILGIVCAALIKLRRDDNKNKAFFKLRYGNFLAVLGIIISVGLLLSSKSNEFRDTLITLFIGVLVYFGYQIFQIKKGKN
ncbi:MAG: amino acid permease [Prolixibacteraceae bacterium]|nr:amino acid permease [Prolixibacteraceae bacterium]MBT6004347.1 amino acid permease [Prolixibacteraceae bacterium]MBT6764057.1 amino acid permease [Prolixibacteraceae bacterium]MBT6998067.1 amino acid permease [Prolixibacteraceae bacterium]MBT7395210.1 amino acid permease [Prolixibacteraceae bacterium]